MIQRIIAILVIASPDVHLMAWDPQNVNPDKLQHNLSHELAHYFGLDDRLDASCVPGTTVMDAFPTTLTPCYSGTSYTGMQKNLTDSDTEALTRSTYGNANRKVCGW